MAVNLVTLIFLAVVFEASNGLECASCTNRSNMNTCVTWTRTDCDLVSGGAKSTVCVFYPSVDPNSAKTILEHDKYCMSEERVRSIYGVTTPNLTAGVCNASPLGTAQVSSLYNESSPYVCTCADTTCDSSVSVKTWLGPLGSLPVATARDQVSNVTTMMNSTTTKVPTAMNDSGQAPASSNSTTGQASLVNMTTTPMPAVNSTTTKAPTAVVVVQQNSTLNLTSAPLAAAANLTAVPIAVLATVDPRVVLTGPIISILSNSSSVVSNTSSTNTSVTATSTASSTSTTRNTATSMMATMNLMTTMNPTTASTTMMSTMTTRTPTPVNAVPIMATTLRPLLIATAPTGLNLNLLLSSTPARPLLIATGPPAPARPQMNDTGPGMMTPPPMQCKCCCSQNQSMMQQIICEMHEWFCVTFNVKV